MTSVRTQSTWCHLERPVYLWGHSRKRAKGIDATLPLLNSQHTTLHESEPAENSRLSSMELPCLTRDVHKWRTIHSTTYSFATTSAMHVLTVISSYFQFRIACWHQLLQLVAILPFNSSKFQQLGFEYFPFILSILTLVLTTCASSCCSCAES